METRALTWNRLVLPIAGALVCLLLMFLAYQAFGGSLPLQPHGYRVALQLPSAQNVVDGADVKTAGVTIGRVVKTGRDGAHARATLEIQSRYAPLHEGVRAIVRVKSLLGEGYIELSPGRPAAPTIREGAVIPRSATQPTVQLDSFLSTFGPTTRKRMQDLFAGLATAYGSDAENLSDTLGYAAPVTSDFTTVVRTLDGQSRDLSRLLARAGDMFASVGERPALLRQAIRAGDDVMSATARHGRALTATVNAMPGFLAQLQTTSRSLIAANGDLARATRALRPVSSRVAPALDAVSRSAPTFRRLFDEIPPTVRAADRGLPSLDRILRALPSAFDGLYPSARELIPLMDLLSAYRREVIGTIANGGGVTNGKVVGAGGKIISRGGGAITVWNESIGGWKKKLPSSRSNPYPRPGTTNDFATQGYFKSYDCRHTGNPLYLPPLGTGSPPCVTQGPWTFRGKTAYYPRLLKAAP